VGKNIWGERFAKATKQSVEKKDSSSIKASGEWGSCATTTGLKAVGKSRVGIRVGDIPKGKKQNRYGFILQT